ncbi:MAG: peptidoglycan DD-metalloendopeptidase family protein [Oscillospiraceae bacterium]
MNNKKIASAIAVLLALLMVLSLVFSVIPVSAYADELDDLQAQKNDLSNQVKECQERLTLLKERQSNVLEQKAALDEQNKLANEQLELVAKEIDAYTKLIEEKAEEVEAARTKEERQLALYQARVRAMEESGGFNILAVIVNSQNFSQLLTAIDDMSEIMASDRELQEEYVAAREETEAIKAEYEAEKAEYEEAQTQLEEERAEIGRQIQANTEELESLQDEIDKAIQEYEAAEAAEAAAAATIANMIAEYQRKKAEEAAANQSAIIDQMNQANEEAIANGQEPPYTEEDIQNATNSGSSTGGASSTGGLTWPVPCSTRVTSRFGTRTDPFTGQTATHNGIDIDGFNNDGNIIVAAADGTVITASYDGAYGNYVVIDHGDITTLYAHMSGMAVSAGDYVSAGQTIGYLGATGRATGTHCHFEVFVGGSRVDPASYFSGLTYYNC